jgi:hypothetical protein
VVILPVLAVISKLDKASASAVLPESLRISITFCLIVWSSTAASYNLASTSSPANGSSRAGFSSLQSTGFSSSE